MIGRRAQLGRIEAFLAAVAEGPAALLLKGEPGMGKTTLWHAAVERAAAGHRVLACRPVEAEAERGPARRRRAVRAAPRAPAQRAAAHPPHLGRQPVLRAQLARDPDIPASLRERIGGRLRALSAAQREAVQLASTLSRPTGEPIPGVLERDGERLRFSHPLLAEVAYAQVADKRALHARAAELTDDPEERARHLALAADGPDEAVGRELVAAARRARARGAPDATAALLEQARAHGDAARRGIEAAERHLEAGDTERARALLEAVAQAPGPHRALALARLGWVRAPRDGFRIAAETFAATLREPLDDLALRIDIEEGLAWPTRCRWTRSWTR